MPLVEPYGDHKNRRLVQDNLGSTGRSDETAVPAAAAAGHMQGSIGLEGQLLGSCEGTGSHSEHEVGKFVGGSGRDGER